MIRDHAGLNGYPAKHDTLPGGLPRRSLPEVCLELNDKINAFLAEEPATPLLRSVQEQLRVALAVVDETFERYQYVRPLRQDPSGCLFLFFFNRRPVHCYRYLWGFC